MQNLCPCPPPCTSCPLICRLQQSWRPALLLLPLAAPLREVTHQQSHGLQVEQLTEKVQEQLAQVEQLSEQFEWLQAEHQRVSGSNQDLEQQNRLLQEDCTQLQVQ